MQIAVDSDPTFLLAYNLMMRNNDITGDKL